MSCSLPASGWGTALQRPVDRADGQAWQPLMAALLTAALGWTADSRAKLSLGPLPEQLKHHCQCGRGTMIAQEKAYTRQHACVLRLLCSQP